MHQTLSLLNNMAKLNRLKAVLAEQDKTSKWLAEQVGKSAYTVSKWCNNSVQPDLNNLDKIATLLEVDSVIIDTFQSRVNYDFFFGRSSLQLNELFPYK